MTPPAMESSPQTSTARYRYLILCAAVAMQACLGATYSWAVFVQPLKNLAGVSQGSAQLPFTMFYIVFPAMALFAGPIIRRLGPRWSAVAGGVVFGSGWMTASLGGDGFVYVIVGIGVLGGLGVGMAYVVPIATCIRWFPRQKGLVTGLAVAGFGGGAAAIGQMGDYLMTSEGQTPFRAFGALGLAYMVLVGLAGLTMRWPREGEVNSENSGSSVRRNTVAGASSASSGPPLFRNVLSERSFQVLYLAMFCGLMAGFAVNANLKHLSASGAARTGVNAVSLFALANALGRVVWGWLFDRIRKPTVVIRANLVFQAILLIATPWLLGWGPGLLAVATVAGFNYGGVLVLYASSVAVRWGAGNVGYVYGWLFSSNIPASLAPMLAAVAYDRWGSFTVPLVLIAAIELWAVWFVRATIRSELDRER